MKTIPGRSNTSKVVVALAVSMAALVASFSLLPRCLAASTQAEAKKACTEGRVEDGIAILAELYLATRHPNYIYNQGRCYETNGLFADAVERFELYGKQAGSISPAEREKLQARIERLQARAKKAGQVPKEPPDDGGRRRDDDAETEGSSREGAAAAGAAVDPPPPPAAPAPAPSQTLSLSDSQAGEDPPLHRRPWFWVGAGAVAAVIVVGIVVASAGSKTVGFDCPTCNEVVGVGP